MSAENMMIVGQNKETAQVQLMLYGAAFLNPGSATAEDYLKAQTAARRIALCVNTLADYTDEELAQGVVTNAFIQGANHALNAIYGMDADGRAKHNAEMQHVLAFLRDQGLRVHRRD